MYDRAYAAKAGYITIQNERGEIKYITEDQALEMAKYWFEEAGLDPNLIKGITVSVDVNSDVPFHILVDSAELLDWYSPPPINPNDYFTTYEVNLGDVIENLLEEGRDILEHYRELKKKVDDGTATPEEKTQCEQIKAEAEALTDYYTRHSDEFTPEERELMEGIITIGTEGNDELTEKVEKIKEKDETPEDPEEVEEEDGEEDEEEKTISSELIEYLKSLGIDETEIPDQITVEWLREIAQRIGIEELKKFFTNRVFNVDHYITISLEDVRVEDEEAVMMKKGSFRWTVSRNYQNGTTSNVSMLGGDVHYETLSAKVTTVTAEGTVQRSRVVKMYYRFEETLIAQPFGWVISTKSTTINGTGEEGLLSKRVQVSEGWEPVFSATYVIEDDDKTVAVYGPGLEDYIMNLQQYITTITSMSGYWINGIQYGDGDAWIIVTITQGNDGISTFRVK
jgi:hypothetical protein